MAYDYVDHNNEDCWGYGVPLRDSAEYRKRGPVVASLSYYQLLCVPVVTEETPGAYSNAIVFQDAQRPVAVHRVVRLLREGAMQGHSIEDTITQPNLCTVALRQSNLNESTISSTK